ncbi:uncharacterized protein LACBIDRAFT_395936 [Laccaria bicolor S238N-H82]|uniref:Predicted protein n=1 Tax=Laccaria bicolor (strain S238N-H82 / ATCC MYA-4686) TaxID=486041 RepID=B0DXM5_LACBS|nr:uncharacterized protein LACBIDRAFT_395936 [Laccaria bicolor S238N-H82]EDR00706.1 predicted protein [Laccaria bicolor S238N-H82]|eukprot:XP_001888715.1 predicted protein [Laccaria bicolor S238N-H82]
MPRPGHQIYEEEMILKSHGFPVWYGDPYGRAEIEIGDIGYMSEGKFKHVMKCNFDFDELVTNPVIFNGPIYSLSLERREVGAEAGVSAPPGAGVKSRISLTSSRNTCAMLNVEEGVADDTSCSDVDKMAVGEIFLQNARKWIAEAVKGRRLAGNISIERLILVTGFYKSANWEAAALSSSSYTTNLSFTIEISQAEGGISLDWNSVQHLSPDYSTGHRHPSQLPSSLQFLRGSSDIRPHVSFEKCCHQHADRTQCIFLRGFRIRERLGRKDQVVKLSASEDSESKLTLRERFMRFVNTDSKTSKPHSGESSQRSASAYNYPAYNYLEAIEESPDNSFCDQLYDTVAIKKFMENDSDLILVHDDELIGILKRDAAALDSEPGSSDERRAVCQTLYDRAIGELKKPDLKPENKFQLLNNTVDILGNILRDGPHFDLDPHSNLSPHLNLSPSIEIRPLISDLGRSKEKGHQEAAQQFLDQLTDPSIFILSGHTSTVCSVTFSPDNRRIASGSNDRTVRIWDAETGKPVGEPFQGHGRIMSVAFSPDGKHVVSGSVDQTVNIWDVGTGKPMGEPLRGHTDSVCSVAFSPDSTRIASGSLDQAIRIWDATTWNLLGEPFRGHTKGVRSLAFSPDGRSVVSGSDDQTVRIWDVETGKPLGEPFRGHTKNVNSVAFSPDGERVFSGSLDGIVRIWDPKTGKQLGEPFRGHTKDVDSIAFSPDGERVVSGSFEGTVRIWDAKTGKLVRKPFQGHTDGILSVAFSPDGRRVVSGSYDQAVRIWDAEKQWVPEPTLNTLDVTTKPALDAGKGVQDSGKGSGQGSGKGVKG